MKVTKHARERFKQRTDIIKINSIKVDCIPNGTIDAIIENIFGNSVSIGEWIDNKRVFGAVYSKQYDLITIYCANSRAIVTIYRPNDKTAKVPMLLKSSKDRLDDIDTPMNFQIQLNLFDLKFKINYAIDHKDEKSFTNYTQEYNELLAIMI